VKIVGPFVNRMTQLGEFNFVLGNGESLIAHAHTRLYALRRSCRKDGCRQTVVLLATSPLTEEPWVQLASGSIHVYANGQERSAVARSTRGRIVRAASKVSAVQRDQMR
jgi:predicted glutamine amidotransferase